MAFDQEPDQILDQLEFAANDLLKRINEMTIPHFRLRSWLQMIFSIRAWYFQKKKRRGNPWIF